MSSEAERAGAPASEAATERQQEGHASPVEQPTPQAVEIGGPPGPEPTRYGDWERRGRCSDF
jgi:hypothetical protein